MYTNNHLPQPGRGRRTYIRMERGFVYLTAVVDVYSRRILAHRVAITMEVIHAKEVLQEALNRYGVPEIVNTDQGPLELVAAVLATPV